MKIDDFREWYRPEYLVTVESIIKKEGSCLGAVCPNCPFVCTNSTDSNITSCNQLYTDHLPEKANKELLNSAKAFKKIYEDEEFKLIQERTKEMIKNTDEKLNKESFGIKDLKKGMFIVCNENNLSGDIGKTYEVDYITMQTEDVMKRVVKVVGRGAFRINEIDWEKTKEINVIKNTLKNLSKEQIDRLYGEKQKVQEPFELKSGMKIIDIQGKEFVAKGIEKCLRNRTFVEVEDYKDKDGIIDGVTKSSIDWEATKKANEAKEEVWPFELRHGMKFKVKDKDIHNNDNGEYDRFLGKVLISKNTTSNFKTLDTEHDLYWHNDEIDWEATIKLNENRKIGIKITGDVNLVLEKLEKLGYVWSYRGDQPTKWKPCKTLSELKYIFMHTKKKELTWAGIKQNCDFVMEDKVLLKNYMIEKPTEIEEEFPVKPEQYVIWNPKGCNPKKIHEGIESAEKEVERLVSVNVGQEFYVLKVVKKAKAEINVRWE